MSEEIRREQIFTNVEEYMRNKHSTLINDYKTPEGNYVENCTLIAVDIAKMLLDSGERPELVRVQGPQITQGGWVGNEPVIPKIYEGRVRWGAHVICVSNNIVYDPMIGEPKPLAEYINNTFIGPVETKTTVSKDEIETFVSR
jgi:hypothetical protein